MPTVCCRSPRDGSKAAMQVASTNPTMKAVAKTGGMSPKSPNSG
jgi:hypothetical protein